MKKVLSLVLVLILCCSLFAGCHGKMAATSDDAGLAEPIVYTIPENFDTSRNYEISFWAKNDTNITQVDIYKKAISDFESCYPNITVNLRLYTDYGKIYNDVITNIATDTTPNVCITYPDHIATVTILKVIECWNSYVWPRLITDEEAYFLVSNGIQSIRENGFGRENIPAMMAAVVVISAPLIVLFLIFRNKIMAGVARGGTKG